MKKSGIFAASVAAASATAISTTCSSSSKIHLPHGGCFQGKSNENSAAQGASSSDKFAPRFDGLRFIETLVTAHR
ncbi:hypothetical protein F511_07924 [Dorcoceras hygrometricum]|uniref:Uncharacterized protein n=1 Tax=Dorcoceras hygrometricum TaxID=472368 RepID=A0A2Z7CH56_9LAMI|nr:hypothetical protein F511_07924 [Dorcoceras hygrometricum]